MRFVFRSLPSLALVALSVAAPAELGFKAPFGAASMVDVYYEEHWETHPKFKTNATFQNEGSGIPATEMRGAFMEGGGFASSDLVDGTLHAHSWAGAPRTFTDLETGKDYTGYSYATALALMWDTVTITPGPQETRIPLRLEVDGFATQDANALATIWISRLGSYQPEVHTMGVVSGFHGTFTVDAELLTPLVPTQYFIWASLSTYCYPNNFSDFSHTAKFQWNLPEGTTFSSASGVFNPGKIQAVPEPASFAALAIGGLTVLRRRRPSLHNR